jgi:arsenate reductase (thioredoxin)
MAEGVLRSFAGDRFDAFSAGIEASHVRLETIAVMDEIGPDIRSQQNKTLERYLGDQFDWLITVCDTARQGMPDLPGVDRTAPWGVDYPAAVSGGGEDGLRAFRMARDELRNGRLLLITACRPDLPREATRLTDR